MKLQRITVNVDFEEIDEDTVEFTEFSGLFLIPENEEDDKELGQLLSKYIETEMLKEEQE